MDSQLRFAAIDIDSNAVRLLLSGVFEEAYSPTFRKMSLIRMPIRLGDDAFTQKCISDSKVSQLVRTMIGFKHLIDAFQPLDFMACATSAMREAENGPEICKKLQNGKFREGRLPSIDLLLRNHPERFLPIGSENTHTTF